MTSASVSTPGKLILMGEHAAVYGRPALVTAIDLRLRVDIDVRPGDRVHIESPLLDRSDERRWREILDETRDAREEWSRWVNEPNGVDWNGPGRAGLVRLALGETVNHLEESNPPGLDLHIDSDLPVGSGFGSSAAAGLAVAGATLVALGREPDEETLRAVSIETERRQHGTPSGVDTEAVLRGGLLWCRRDEGGPLQCEAVRVQSDHLLDGLRVFQSGTPAETTGEVVAQVRKARTESPEQIDGIIAEIAETTSKLRDQIEGKNGDRERFAALLRRCQGCLEALGVVPHSTKEMIRRVEAEGGAAKVSGAGSLTGIGAGSILVFHPDPTRMIDWRFLSAWTQLPVGPGAEGLRVEVTA